MMLQQPLLAEAENLLKSLEFKGLMLASAESCTGGLIGGYLTEIPGSSAVFSCGFITYSNEAKMRMLGVSSRTLESFGAVSEETAREMARGAVNAGDVDIAVAVTGIAGPGGGSDEKPVGLVHLSTSDRNATQIHKKTLYGPLTRSQIRQATVKDAFLLVAQHLNRL